jgi:hypothetical protein
LGIGTNLKSFIQPVLDSESKPSPSVWDSITNLLEGPVTLAQSKNIDKTHKSPGDLTKKLRNDMIYIRNSLKFEDNSNTLEHRIKKFEENSSVLVNALALNGGSKFEDKLDLLNKVVIKLKHQISSSNKLSPTDSDTWYKNIDINEFHYKQVRDILPVLHLDGNFMNSSALRDFRKVYNSLARTTKLCLFCFAIIPENEVVKKRFMTYWWVGEGFVSPQKPGQRYEEVAEEIFQELETKGCIESEEKKFRDVADSCKMDPFIRSAVIVLAKEAGFFDFDVIKGNPTAKFKSSHRACLVDGLSQELVKSGSESDAEKSGSKSDTDKSDSKLDTEKSGSKSDTDKSDSKLDIEKSGSKSDTDKSRSKLDTEKSDKSRSKLDTEKSGSKSDTDKSRSESNAKETDPEKLQVIFNVNEPYPDVFDLEWFSKLKNVKVLYLGRWQTSAKHHIEVEGIEFLAGLNSMKLLRFLSLQGVSRITKLPLSMCKLQNLMFLDLRACHNLEALPDWIGELSRLTHLDISECYLLDYMPKGICALSKLQVLKGFVISKRNSSRAKYCTLRDLVKLTELRKLSIYINTKDLDVYALQQFKALQKLTVTWGAEAFQIIKPESDADKDKSAAQPKEATPKSPQMSEDALKQVDGVAQPMSESSMNPENGENNRKQDGGAAPSMVATSTSSKNVEDKKTQGVGVAQPIAATTKRPQDSEDVVKRDEGVAQPIMTATTTTPKNCWGNKKQDKAVAHPMTDGVFKTLKKLDLKCYPFMTAPSWLMHKKLPELEKLYIRGGNLQNLSLVQDQNDKWSNVKVLRLRFLSEFKMDWKKLRSSFPDLIYLEKFKCPKLTYFPCNEKGVIWLRRP